MADTEQKGAGKSGALSRAAEVQPEPSMLGSLSEGADLPSVISEFRALLWQCIFVISVLYYLNLCVCISCLLIGLSAS